MIYVILKLFTYSVFLSPFCAFRLLFLLTLHLRWLLVLEFCFISLYNEFKSHGNDLERIYRKRCLIFATNTLWLSTLKSGQSILTIHLFHVKNGKKTIKLYDLCRFFSVFRFKLAKSLHSLTQTGSRTNFFFYLNCIQIQ